MRPLIAGLAFLCGIPIFASAQTTSKAVAAEGGHAVKVRAPGRVALSPDGTMLAYTMRGSEGYELHLEPVPASGTVDVAKDRLVTASGETNCSNTDPVWAADSKRLAYTSTCTSKEEKPGQAQIFVYSVDDGKSRQVTHVVGNMQQAAWAPDGKRIAFLFVPNATRSAGALDAMKPWAGVIGEDGVEVQQVWSVAADGGDAEGLTPKDLYVYEFAWSPNSRSLAMIANRPPGEDNWWTAQLRVLHLASGCPTCRAYNKEEIVTVVDPAKVAGALHGLQMAVPKWSPDGKRIAFLGGLMSDEGSNGGDVWVVDAAAADARGLVDVTPGIDGTPTWLTWVNKSTVRFVEDRRGHLLLNEANADARAVVKGSARDLGEVSVSGGAIKNAISVSDAGMVAFTQTGLHALPEIWGGAMGSLRPLTVLNAGVQDTAGRMESVEWVNEGFTVQGWLSYPVNYDPAKKYPIIVTVHGGPSASAGPRYGDLWPAHGYFEFTTNPRGSFGEGEAFTEANRKDFGYGDLRDIEKGLDTIEAKIPAIDHEREGLTGWSYGGFMTMFAVTQTTRFRAAIAGAGISDWLSYYGENSIDQWMIPFFGASVYDDPAVYAKSSAMTFIKRAKTPTLVIVGDRDGECPAPQSFEFWHALRDLGVKTQLVVYPNEGHGFRNPEHIKDRTEREVRWFAENMPAK
jgi:dipeptidyl aminopeptidase/acylaminoacyl peptidase